MHDIGGKNRHYDILLVCEIYENNFTTLIYNSVWKKFIVLDQFGSFCREINNALNIKKTNYKHRWIPQNKDANEINHVLQFSVECFTEKCFTENQ